MKKRLSLHIHPVRIMAMIALLLVGCSQRKNSGATPIPVTPSAEDVAAASKAAADLKQAAEAAQKTADSLKEATTQAAAAAAQAPPPG